MHALNGFVFTIFFRLSSSAIALALAAIFASWRAFFSFSLAAYFSLYLRPRHARKLKERVWIEELATEHDTYLPSMR